MKKTLTLLGSTGSIGTQSLDIVRQFPNDFEIIALSAHSNLELLKTQINEFKPKYICISNEDYRKDLQEWTQSKNLKLTILTGPNGLIELAKIPVDLLVVSLVGTSGILPTYHAIQCGTSIALACKEVLVSAGSLIMSEAKKHKVSLVPIDSEHAAIKQCLQGIELNHIEHITLTASGGPFRDLPLEKFKDITLEQALKHPNWSMGQKISVDSATMVNKGLEIIEAHHLFQIPYEKIQAIIHPQSMIHGIVEFIDGNVLAHISPTDMRFPIQYALFYPQKKDSPFKRFSFLESSELTFKQIDYKKFPLLKTAIECGKKGGSYPVIFNAANEAAVQLFLTKQIHFMQIESVIENQLEQFNHRPSLSLEEILEIDAQTKKDVLCSTLKTY
jgi:1-deoxy-D-xylulose-5-phosphate reductoisomerase